MYKKESCETYETGKIWATKAPDVANHYQEIYVK